MKKNKLSGGYRKNAGKGKKGKYHGIYCDSTWELAYLIYNLDNGIKIKRNSEGFEYFYNNGIHRYYPDFIVEGKYIEVKGYKDEKWRIKEKLFPFVELIDKNSIYNYINYVISKYHIKENELYKLYDSKN